MIFLFILGAFFIGKNANAFSCTSNLEYNFPTYVSTSPWSYDVEQMQNHGYGYTLLVGVSSTVMLDKTANEILTFQLASSSCSYLAQLGAGECDYIDYDDMKWATSTPDNEWHIFMLQYTGAGSSTCSGTPSAKYPICRYGESFPCEHTIEVVDNPEAEQAQQEASVITEYMGSIEWGLSTTYTQATTTYSSWFDRRLEEATSTFPICTVYPVMQLMDMMTFVDDQEITTQTLMLYTNFGNATQTLEIGTYTEQLENYWVLQVFSSINSFLLFLAWITFGLRIFNDLFLKKKLEMEENSN